MTGENRRGDEETLRSEAAPARRLGKTVARGAAYSGTAQGLKVLISMALMVVVARILTPSDYGVIAMTAPISGFILIFQNLGLNQALIQSREISDEQVNALFFYNLAASAAVAIVFVMLSPLVGMFYGDPRPAYVMAASGATVLVTGSALQHSALLSRHMRYKALSFVDVMSTAATFLFTLAFAIWLRNYWSLWLGAFVGAVVTALLLWRIDRWRPRRRIAWRSARHLVTFGANLTGFNLLNFLARNLDNVLIAKFWGPDVLGLYERSYKLMMFPLQNINSPLSRIMLPALARVQDEPDRYRRIYCLAVRSIAFACIPGIIAAAICSDRLVPFLLGEQWASAGPIFFWLCLAAITQPISNATGWLFVSTGRTNEMFRWSLFATPLTIAGFAIGLPWGATGVAAAYFAVQVICVPVLYRWSTRNSPVRALDLYGAALSPLLGGALAWLVDHGIKAHVGFLPRLCLVFLSAYLFSAAFQALTRGGRLALREFANLMRSAFLGQPSSSRDRGA